jgi:hypothetical protein
MAELPTFFFSHARLDRESPGAYMRRFFDKLEYDLKTWIGAGPGVKLGTIDDRINDADWDDGLSRALGEARVFIAVFSPRYFNRPNCGKELSTFLLRIPGLNIDTNGSLAHIRNVVAIRWLPEEAYLINGSLPVVPVFLRRLQDTPPEKPGDVLRARALKRYRDKGLQSMVGSGRQYEEIVNAFIVLIKDMQSVPPGPNASFATAIDAFNYDWSQHFQREPQFAELVHPAARLAPEPLTSMVVFYITARQFTEDQGDFAEADRLIAEPVMGTDVPTESELAQLLSDFRFAGVTESMRVYHASATPSIPLSHVEFVARLSALSRDSVPVAVVVDADVYPRLAESRAVIDQIINSTDWVGPVLMFGGSEAQMQSLLEERRLSPRLLALPEAGESRVTILRRILIDARGRTLRDGPRPPRGAEPLPLLRSPGAANP